MTLKSDDLCDLVQRGYRFAYALAHDAARADDLLQEAWLSVLKARGPWTREYLFAAIRNRFIDVCRRNALVAFEPLIDADRAECVAENAACEIDESATLDAGALGGALARLRNEERAVIYLTVVEELTAQQVAEMFGWPRGTVLSLAHRARKKLREWIRLEPGACA